MIIIGYQGIGKSTLANRDLKYIDLENDNDFDVKERKTVLVDGEEIKADTWYRLENGELVETD